jgi:dTDP-4-dehydrorhamnose reductase
LKVVSDQHGTPNWAGTLADAVVHVVSQGVDGMTDKAGLYHLTARGATTWHGFASAIVAAGTRRIPVHAISTAEFPTPAKRPAYSVLDGTKFERAFGFAMPTWERSLADCLSSPAPT